MSSVRFKCHRCCQPLKLSQHAGGSCSAPGEPREAQEDGGPSTESAEAGASGSPLPDGGGPSLEGSTFALLGKVAPMRTLSSIQKALSDISDILSGQQDVDQPLCEECTDALLQEVDAQLTATELDNQEYRRCLETSLLMGEMGEDETEEQEAELQALELEETTLAQELEALDEERARAAAALRAAQAETSQLLQQERRLQADCAALTWQQLELLDELGSVRSRLRRAQAQLALLRSAGALDWAFQIREEGGLGVINNLRLGRLPGVPVGWAEVNAAWGQAALLLLALSRAAGLRFRRYQLVARGARSCLKPLAGDAAELPLFSDARRAETLDNSFDLAMLAFLDCLQQFEEAAAEDGLRPPYRTRARQGVMEDPRGGQRCSVRTHLNTPEQWSTALRFLLLNLKCGLSWASAK